MTIKVVIYAWRGSDETDWEEAEFFNEADQYIVCIEDHDPGPDGDWAVGLEENYHTSEMLDAIEYAKGLIDANDWKAGDPWSIPNKWKTSLMTSDQQI